MQVKTPQLSDEVTRLRALRGYGVLDSPPEEAFDELVALAAEVCDTPAAFISLVDERREWFKARVGLEVAELPRKGGFSERVMELADLLIVPDLSADARLLGNPLLAGKSGFRFFAGVPLVTADGHPLGALGVMDRVPRSLSDSQQRALRRLGGLVMLQLESRSQTRELIGSGRRLRAIIENEPECVKLLGPDCELLEMNPAGLRMIEADSLEQVVGHSVLGLVLPEHRAAFSSLAMRVREGESDSLKFEIQGLKGTRRWLEIHAVPLRDDSGEIVSLLGITRDISGWMRSQALLDDQRQTLERIASGAALEMTLLDLARFIETQAPGLLCSVVLLDPDGVHLRHGAAPSLPDEFSHSITGAVIGEGVGSCGTAAFRREPVFVADIATDPLWADYRESALAHGLAACWSTPIFDEQQRVLGTFAVYYRKPGLPEAEHLQLIGIATHLAAIAIARHREGEALRRNYALLEAVMEGSTDIIFVKDLEGRYQFINSAGARLARLSVAEIVGRTDAELFPVEIARQFRERDEAVMAAGEARTDEESGILLGSPRFFSANKAPWRDARGRMLGIVGVTRDITARRQAEAALHAGEERFRLFMDHSPTIAWVKDDQGRYVYLTKPFEKRFGIRLEDWRGKTDAEVWPRSMAEVFRKHDLEVMAAGHAIESVELTRSEDGEVTQWLSSKFPFHDAEGNRFVGGIGLDITERMRAEEELHASETNYRTLVESASDGILVSDMQGRLLDVNAAACRMFGYTREEMLGMINTEIIAADEAHRVTPEMERLKAGGVVSSDWKTCRKDGTQFPSEVSATVLPDGRALAIVRDVSERKKLEQQFLRAQRMESIGKLAGGIAHDLNNALGPILMSLDLLKLKFPDRASHELLEIIGSSAQRGADMVAQVLSFARGVEGRRMEVQVRQLLQEVERIVNDTFLKNIAVKLTVAPDLWTVAGDPTQLHQVLLNLCVNARDAMPYGGRLDLSAENIMLDARYVGMNLEASPGPHIFIRVEDNGTGIPPEVMENIFDPFFTTKEIGKGTGLGLSTSLAIVKSHGGFIQVYSEEGKGTAFKVYLPARVESSPPVPEPATDLPRGHGELILVIDDEVLVGQITQQTLEAFGYRVLLATDGADAVAIYAGHQDEIAAVMTDMMMPVMDGPATIQVLKRMDPAVRIIATSGLSSTDHMKQVARLGVNGFLAKPYTAQALLHELKEVIEGSRTSPG